MTTIRGLLFDKDGTIFDFQRTWGPFTAQEVRTASQGDSALAARIADVLDFDLDQEVFRPSSVVIAGTNQDIQAALEAGMDDLDVGAFIEQLRIGTATAPQVPVTDLPNLFEGFRDAGYALGIATNDAEEPARANLAQVGIEGMFDFISGYDSGYGSKPEPGPLLAFAKALNLAPAEVAMVGDSTHDLFAAKAAGMARVAVLTGPATADELAPYADVVLPDIGALPDWLSTSPSP